MKSLIALKNERFPTIEDRDEEQSQEESERQSARAMEEAPKFILISDEQKHLLDQKKTIPSKASELKIATRVKPEFKKRPLAQAKTVTKKFGNFGTKVM